MIDIQTYSLYLQTSGLKVRCAVSNLLCFTGVLLFVMGLVTGFAIPAFRSSRIGLSAHLTGLQSGTALIAFGFLWPRVAFWPGWDVPLAYAVWISFYLLFFALVLGAVWGTGRSLPIAGGSMKAQPWQERATLGIMALGSFGCLGALAMVLAQWRWLS